MSDLDDFLATTIARQIKAEQALHNGDPVRELAFTPQPDVVHGYGCVGYGGLRRRDHMDGDQAGRLRTHGSPLSRRRARHDDKISPACW
jgi:hypothetical protein